MTPTLLHLASLSVKIALLGGLAYLQLHLLRRAPAAFRSRLCSLALIAVALSTAFEFLSTPAWLPGTAVFHFTANASGQAPPTAGISPGTWVGLLWLAGAGCMLIRAVAGRVTLTLLRRRSTFSGRESGVEIRIADVAAPLLTGLVRPAVLLPSSARDWTAEQRRMVLTHELTHWRRLDAWSNLLAQGLRAAFWFHPAIWLLVSRMSREQELACDEAVVAAGHSPHDYAAFLLDAVRQLRSSELFACSMAGSGARSLKQRLANLLDSAPRPPLTRRLAAYIALFCAIAMTLAVVRPAWSQKDDTKSPTVYKIGDGVTPPRVLHRVDPQYTEEDKDAKVSGTVRLKMVVTEEGTARDITVLQSLSPGLDAKAIQAVQQWTFQPGTKDGVAVAVWANLEVNFRLK